MQLRRVPLHRAQRAVVHRVPHVPDLEGVPLLVLLLQQSRLLHVLVRELTPSQQNLFRSFAHRLLLLDLAFSIFNAHLIEKVEGSIGPVSVAVFNLGSQIGNRSLSETSDKVFERGWRMATLALFRTAKKLFPYMEKRGSGTLLVTSSTAAVRGNKGQHSHAASMGGRRMLCQTLNAEFSSKGIHTTHIIIDGAVDAPDTLGKMLGEEAYQALRKEKGLEKDGLLLPDKIAETYYHLADQHRSAWTHEVDLRAYNDDPWWNTPRNIANSI